MITIRIIKFLTVIGLPTIGTKLCRKCDGVSATRWATKNSVNKCRGCTRDKVEPLPVMGPVGNAHIIDICDHFAGHAFRYVDDVYLRMTGMPGIKCYLVAIWGPAGGPCFRTVDIRHPHQVSSVRITQPYLWGASAIGGKGDVLPIRRVLRLILVMCGGNQLYGGRFRMRQVLAPDVNVARELTSKASLSPLAEIAGKSAPSPKGSFRSEPFASVTSSSSKSSKNRGRERISFLSLAVHAIPCGSPRRP